MVKKTKYSVLITLLIAMTGVYLLVATNAATPSVAIEAENGTPCSEQLGISTIGASNNKAIKFTQGACTTAPNNCPKKTISFVAHQDDDLLFMNPDIASDVKAGFCTYVVYLTDGDDGSGPTYVDNRIQGIRAAWAIGAEHENNWEFTQLTYNGHNIASNYLPGTDFQLIFLYLRAAVGAYNGDLFPLLNSPGYLAQPSDNRASYNKDSLLTTVKSLLAVIDPDYIRIQDTLGDRGDIKMDHIDHVAGAKLITQAASENNIANYTIYEYVDYDIINRANNVAPNDAAIKRDIWNAYIPFDHALHLGDWEAAMDKQYIRRIIQKGQPIP